jgi:pentose-5-phosphate-3-epimerase
MDHVMDKLDVVLLMSVNPASAASPSSPAPSTSCARPAKIDAYTARSGRQILLESTAA